MSAMLLHSIERSGEDALLLCETLSREELLRSRLTQAEVQRLLLQLARGLGALDAPLRERLPELDWDAWAHTSLSLQTPGPARDEALWFAVRALLPATLSWLRVHRAAQPELFVITAAP